MLATCLPRASSSTSWGDLAVVAVSVFVPHDAVSFGNVAAIAQVRRRSAALRGQPARAVNRFHSDDLSPPASPDESVARLSSFHLSSGERFAEARRHAPLLDRLIVEVDVLRHPKWRYPTMSDRVQSSLSTTGSSARAVHDSDGPVSPPPPACVRARPPRERLSRAPRDVFAPAARSDRARAAVRLLPAWRRAPARRAIPGGLHRGTPSQAGNHRRTSISRPRPRSVVVAAATPGPARVRAASRVPPRPSSRGGRSRRSRL